LFGVIPQAILHDPDEIRPMPGASRREAPEAQTIRLPANVMLKNLIESVQICKGTPPPDALNAVAQQFQHLARLPVEDFRRAIQSANSGTFASYIQQLDAVVQAGGPEQWLTDVAATRDACLFSMNCDQPLPIDIERESGPHETLSRFKRLISDFGELLQMWPDLVHCAGDLRALEDITSTSEVETGSAN
jgi:hypothetical protein